MLDTTNKEENLQSNINKLDSNVKISNSLKQKWKTKATHLFQINIPESFKLVEAIDFYDAVALGLNQIKQHSYNSESLKLICKENSIEFNVVYEKNSVLNNDFMNTWKSQFIDAQIVCKIFNINIHVIERQKISIDTENKEKKQNVLHYLINADKLTLVDIQTINYQDSNTVHLAIYNNHYMSIFKNELFSIFHNYSVKSSNSLLKISEPKKIVTNFFSTHEINKANKKFISKIKELSPLDNEEVSKDIREFAINSNQDGYILIDGLAVDPNLCPTPTIIGEETIQKETQYSEFWLSSVIALVGEQFGFKQLNNGNLYHNISPRRNLENAMSSKGSAKILNLHTDLAFHPLAPHFLLLFCLRQTTENTYTVVSSVRNAISYLSKKEISILRGPNFMFLIDEDFGKFTDSRCCSIIYGNDNDLKLRYDVDMIIGINEEAKSAHQALKNILHKTEIRITLQPGQLLMIDNRRAVHGRNAFVAHYDGKDRWFQRAYCHTNYSELLPHLFKPRTVDYNFENREKYTKEEQPQSVMRNIYN